MFSKRFNVLFLSLALIYFEVIGMNGLREVSDSVFIASSTQLSLEKAMAPHSSTLAWKNPWMEEPGGLQSMGLGRIGHD